MKENAITNKIVSWMIKHKKNRFVRGFAKIIVLCIDTYEKIDNYFKKDVHVYVQYIFEDGLKRPNTISGYLLKKGTAHSFTKIPWEKLDDILEEFKASDEPISFEVTHSGGWYQEILFPKWARRMMVEKLENLKLEHLNIPNAV